MKLDQEILDYSWLYPPLVIIPFYRNEHLVEPLIEGLLNAGEDLRSSDAHVLLICDSPDDESLSDSLTRACELLQNAEIPAMLKVNAKNEGFVRSANIGLKMALTDGRDALLLNSDAILINGVLSELRAAIARDPMVGFVSPRSNDAGICTILPDWQRTLSPQDGMMAHAKVASHLPRFRYVPTAVGFCLYIRHVILSEFGLFDEVYKDGYNEENDLIMRANRAGYRAVLSNHAYVHHIGSISFGVQGKIQRDRMNAKILEKRYPQYDKLVHEYYESVDWAQEHILARNNSKVRPSLLVDLSNISMLHNGTTQHAVHTVQAMDNIESEFDIYVAIDEKAAAFHGLVRFQKINILPVHTQRTFDVAIRLSQPWSMGDVRRLANLAPVNIVVMLDSIAWDCGQLRGTDLDTVWRTTVRTVNGIVYISDFVRRQFLTRFGVSGIASLLSTEPSEYLQDDIRPLRQKHILVVGNHFSHKALPETVYVLAKSFPREKIVVMGLAKSRLKNVIAMDSGALSDNIVHRLYRDAKVVVFPSYYEGFGFPVVQAMAYGKTVYARKSPLLMEIAAHSRRPNLIVPFDTLVDLPALMVSPKHFNILPGTPRTWTDHARDIEQYAWQLMNANDVDDKFRRRLEILHTREGCAELDDILQSRSWRMTAPLRKVMNILRTWHHN